MEPPTQDRDPHEDRRNCRTGKLTATSRQTAGWTAKRGLGSSPALHFLPQLSSQKLSLPSTPVLVPTDPRALEPLPQNQMKMNL